MAHKRLHATLTIGGAITSGLHRALGTTSQGLTKISHSITELRKKQQILNTTLAQPQLSSMGTQHARQELQLVQQQLQLYERKHHILRSSYQMMDRGRRQMAQAVVAMGALTAAASSAFMPVIQAARFEDAMLGVAKQVAGARDATGQLTPVYDDLAEAIHRLGHELPMSTNEIAEMVAASARMGIAREALIDFTKTAGRMASAFDMPAHELADQMGKVANLFHIPITQIDALADAINYLDDEALSKGGDIIEVMQRIGGTAQFLKMPAAEAAALASSFLSLGSKAEVAATASNAILRELSIASTQPKRFQAGLKALGLEADQVQKSMQKNATQTVLQVVDLLNRMPEEKRLTTATQLFGKEYGDDIAKLASGVGEYRRQLELTTSSQAVGSMMREHQARLQTLNAQWQIAKNRLFELAVSLGNLLLPSVKRVLMTLGSVTSQMADFIQHHPALVQNVISLGGAVLSSLAAWTTLKFGLAGVLLAWNGLKIATMTNPMGLACVGLITAGTLIYQHWNAIAEFFRHLWQNLQSLAEQAALHIGESWRNLSAGFTDIVDAIGNKWHAMIDGIVAKIRVIGDYWSGFKTLLGLSPSPVPLAPLLSVSGALLPQKQIPQPFLPTALPAPPRTPVSAFPSNLPPIQNNHAPATLHAPQNNVFHITQLPGQDARGLADEVARRINEQRGIQRRSQLFDTYQFAY